jgi:phospholipid N-methyltransferase
MQAEIAQTWPRVTPRAWANPRTVLTSVFRKAAIFRAALVLPRPIAASDGDVPKRGGGSLAKLCQICERSVTVLNPSQIRRRTSPPMTFNDVAREPRITRWKRELRRFLGPSGVFFLGFLEHPAMVVSIIPTSRSTIEKMLAPVDWASCRLLVEYGPGVGTFCRPLLERLPRDASLLVIDTNPLFIDYLRHTITDSRFVAVHGSAEDVEEIIRAHGHDRADYVLSGLPFSTLLDGVGLRIAAATHRAVRPGGAFLTYQFSKVAGNLSARYFQRVDYRFASLNILPCHLAWAWKQPQ